MPLTTVKDIQPPAWPSRDPSDLSGFEPDGPPWASLVLSVVFFCYCSHGPASHLTVPKTIWAEWVWSGQFPLALCNFPLENLFRAVQVYHILCIFVYSLLFFFNYSCFVSFGYSLLNCFIYRFMSIHADYWQLLKLLFDYCSLFRYWKYPGISTL